MFMKENILAKPHYKFKIDNDSEILLNTPSGVFLPTGTTTTLFNAVRAYIRKPGKMLDLGCGCGIVGIALHKAGLVKTPLYASDLSEQAIDCLNKNAAFHNCPVVVKCGSLFKPWENERFDYIVNDVSGIAMDVAGISPWYNNVSCQSGIDGTLLITEVIRMAPEHLNNTGRLFFPIISLSNVEKILNVARDNFSHVEQLTHQEWPLPKDMLKHLPTLKRLQKEGHIQIEERFGLVLWFTEVYVVYNS